MFKQIFIVLALILVLTVTDYSVLAKDFAGTWTGTLEMPGVELDLVFNIIINEDGTWAGTLDVPAQGAMGILLSEVSFALEQVIFGVELISGVFSGNFSSDGQSIIGVWKQSGMQIPITLKQTLPEFINPNRPQEPQPPYPYNEIEVIYPNPEANIELAGTLTLPEASGPFPVALLISGSGPQDRNEELFGHKPFLVLADYLTRRGIAVLRVDDRGVAQSTGDFNSATTLDFTSDVLAGLEYLKSRPEIDSDRMGLIGHSEGGLIAPLAAVENSDVAFMVLMAGPALNGEEISYLQSDLLLRASGVSEELITAQINMLEALFAIMKSEEDLEKAAQEMYLVMMEPYKNLAPEELASVENTMVMQINTYLSPWFQFFMTYDPLPTLREVKCPVLAIIGSKDLQVPANPNLSLIEKALKDGGNGDYTVLELADLNHLFQSSETGSADEYYFIEETMAPLALKTMADWLVRVTGIR